MKRTYRKNILRTVKGTLSRFLSIFAIVALGVGFLSGLLSTTPDMRLSADTYYDDTNVSDIRVLSTLGLTGEDLAAVRKAPGIRAVYAAHDTDIILSIPDGGTEVTRLHSLPADLSQENPAYMNQPTLVSGRMPEKAGECVVVWQSDLTPPAANLGDVLTFDLSDEDLADDFTVSQFEVVGIVKSSYYMSVEKEHSTLGSGTVTMVAYTPDESFASDIYTGFYLTVENAAALNAFESKYDNLIEEHTDQLEVLGKERASLRTDEVIGDANAELSDAKAEYNDAKAEAEEKLADAEKKLTDASREIADGQKELADAKQQIDDNQLLLDRSKDQYNIEIPAGRKAIADAKAQLETSRAQLEAQRPALEASRAQLDAQNANLTALESGKAALFAAATQMNIPYADTSDATALSLIAAISAAAPDVGAQFALLQGGLSALAAEGQTTESVRAALTQGEADYAEGLAAFNDALAQLDSADATLAAKSAQIETAAAQALQAFEAADAALLDARNQYADGEKELADARIKLSDGQKEYEDAKAEADEKLADAAEQIADAESQIRDIEACEWYVWDRSQNLSFASYDSNAEKIEAIARVFPVFFFLVAALVVLTTMTRMVEDERGQIGVMKALGYSGGAIMTKYLLYALIAGALGSAVGLGIGVRLFPSIIINAYNIMYEIPTAITPFNMLYGPTSAAAMIFCALAATFAACKAELSESPAQLMLPRAPKAGKRVFLEQITPLWSRMKFTHKVTARNLLRYKKRFFMTVVGIAGCTALLVTGFGIKDSISDIVSKQFDELYSYNLIVSMKDASALEGRDLSAILSDKTRVEQYMAVSQQDGKMVPSAGKPQDSIYIFAPQDTQRYNEFFNFRHRTNEEPVVFDDNAVIISEKLAERQGLAVGDTITVQNKDEVCASFVITDICENYIQHYLFISQSAYETAFGAAPENNVLLCQALGDTPAQNSLAEQILKCRDIAGIQFTSELAVSFANSIRSINSIVVVLIVCAGALAFVVLYNLTNINIAEREKELATIKVLGFYEGEVASYIFREIAILTLFGIAVGLFGGVFLHQFVIRTAEVDLVMFGRAIYPLSFVYAALLTGVFSFLVCLVMRVKLNRISMVESLKAPE